MPESLADLPPAWPVLPTLGKRSGGGDDVTARVWSTPDAAPHPSGDRRDLFGAELRSAVPTASRSRSFTEGASATGLRMWRRLARAPSPVPNPRADADRFPDPR